MDEPVKAGGLHRPGVPRAGPGPRLGLTSAEAAERAARGLANRQDGRSSRSLGAIARANLLTFFNGLILACFTVLFVLGSWQDALYGFAALANAVIGIGQEWRAKRSLDRLSMLTAPTARVLRDGSECVLAREEVVLDDVLVLRAGDQVPADAVVLEATRLGVDESLLTGEWEPVLRTGGEPVLSGSAVVAGEALARVTAVGEYSFASRLTAESRRFSLVRSELRGSVDRLLRWIGWAVVPLALLVVNGQMQVQGGWPVAIADGSWRTAAVDAVAAVMPMIPLGLVLMTSISFAVGAVALARRGVLVQELAAVEGLARVDVLCLDKTGTLTDGQTVLDAVYPAGGESDPPATAWGSALGWFASEPSAGPTLRSLATRFPAPEGLRLLARIRFSSDRKWGAATLDGAAAGTWVLGAPEIIAALPEFEAERGDSGQDGVVRTAAELASSGLRTLLLAHTPAPLRAAETEAEQSPPGLRAVAALAFRERLRPEAAATLSYFREEGVEVRILSGDSPATVAAVARAAGLDAGPGFDARALPDDPGSFAREVLAHRILARVTPAQKRRIVQALQAAGHTVAMTGDGVNDALAIKDADLGIAMGSGSAATKAVSRVVLLEDSFAHLPAVLAQGRRVMANIERVSILFLTKTVYAMALAAVLGVALVQTPFLPRQLSVTDGLTIGIPAFFLTLLPNTRRHVPGFLRRALGSAVPNGIVVAVCLLVITLVGDAASLSTAQTRTATTLVLTVLGLWVLGSQATPLTGWRLAVVAAMAASAALVYALPWAVAFLGFAAPPAWFAWLSAATAVVGSAALQAVHHAARARPPHARAEAPATGSAEASTSPDRGMSRS